MRGLCSRNSLLVLTGATALVVVCLVLLTAGEADAASSYIDFDRYASYATLTAGTESGVYVKKLPGGTGAVRLRPGVRTGTLTSRSFTTATRFDTLVPSWNAATPAGTYIQTEVRVRSGGRWTPWFNMGVWARGTETIKRHSVNGQSTSSWQVATDTLESKGRIFADAYQYRLKLSSTKSGASPEVGQIAFSASNSYRHGEFLGVTGSSALLGKDLAVPQRSQMIYPDGGEVWCSPTSLSMVMAYWSGKTGNRSLNQPVPTVAAGTYDSAYRGNGNWPFNTAYASAYGLRASVNRFSSLGQVERWIASGVPVIASISWGSGQLSGAPIPASNGHLLVIRGFDKSGKYVIVNDPAASSNSGVRRVYSRQQFADAWLERGSGGVAYLVYPRGWKIPDQTYSRGSW